MKTKWVIVSLLFFVSSLGFGAQTLTAPLQGPRLILVKEEGILVKKGEALIKYRPLSIEALIESAQANLKEAEEYLKDKEADYSRYKHLQDNNSVSVEVLENIGLVRDEAMSNVADCKAKLKGYQNLMVLTTIPAPYDCKVSKVLLAANSGTEYGTPIMQISPISNSDTSLSEPSLSVRTITSSMLGGIITYTAPKGSTVKKGEVLVKEYNPATVDRIDALQEAKKNAEKSVTENTVKYNRYSKLREKNSTSINDFENVVLAYHKARYTLADVQKALEYYHTYNFLGTIKAPFDCRVTGVMLIIGSGTKDGTPIMEIEPLDKSDIGEGLSIENSRTVTSTLNDGFVISYLPNDGQIIKKDEPLVKYDATLADIEFDRAKLALAYEKLNLKDKERDYKRCNYLSGKNSISKENCENSELEYEMAKMRVRDCEAKIEYVKGKCGLRNITAPYDCKVTKVMLAVGDGVEFGTPIMKIDKL